MFETKKTLIVVYKDELLMNQLKKLVESHDDNQEIVGTRDNSINIVSWTEKVWLDNKKAGNIKEKILFLGDIKGTDDLIPVIDIKYSEYGVKFGWAGNQAVVFANPKILTKRTEYDEFLEKLSNLPIPEFLKISKENLDSMEETDQKQAEEEVEAVPEEMVKSALSANMNAKKKKYRRGVLKVARKALSFGANAVDKVGNQVALKSEELFRNKSLMKRQMMFYGVFHLYEDGLEQFMNL